MRSPIEISSRDRWELAAPVDRTYPLSETAAAHVDSETEYAIGKVVIGAIGRFNVNGN